MNKTGSKRFIFFKVCLNIDNGGFGKALTSILGSCPKF